MGWLRLVGSLKLQVSFAKEPYKRDDILQKRPIILRSLLIVATPYHLTSSCFYLISPCLETSSHLAGSIWWLWLLSVLHELASGRSGIYGDYDMRWDEVKTRWDEMRPATCIYGDYDCIYGDYEVKTRWHEMTSMVIMTASMVIMTAFLASRTRSGIYCVPFNKKGPDEVFWPAPHCKSCRTLDHFLKRVLWTEGGCYGWNGGGSRILLRSSSGWF